MPSLNPPPLPSPTQVSQGYGTKEKVCEKMKVFREDLTELTEEARRIETARELLRGLQLEPRKRKNDSVRKDVCEISDKMSLA